MLKNLIYLCIGLFFHLTNNAQVNIVPNPSFELYNSSECWGNNLVSNPFASHIYVYDWQTFKYLTPDYFNVCSNFDTGYPYPNATSIPLHCGGYQYPHTGNAFVGICLFLVEQNAIDYREIIAVRLEDSLIKNHCYYSEFYLNLSNYSNVVINNIQMMISDTIDLYNPFNFNNTSQAKIQWDTSQFFTDTLNWVKVAGKFLAQGGEKYLSIGNYKDSSNIKLSNTPTSFTTSCNYTNHRVSYVYIDDVALYELPSPHIQNTAITICPNADSLILGDTARIHTRYQWYANGLAIDTTSYIKVKPTQTTTYVLQTTQCAITTQSIVVTYSSNCEPVVVVEPIIPNVFTPNNDSINDVWRFNLGKGNVLKEIAIFNRWGNEMSVISRTSVTEIRWDGRTTSGEETPSGVYYFVLRYTDVNGDEHRKNGYVTLMR